MISIHVPREGHDGDDGNGFCAQRLFQSTCPARGTTMRIEAVGFLRVISIHVPREGHDGADNAFYIFFCLISIHVPREGHDNGQFCPHGCVTTISIHVPREGHDSKHAQFFRADLRKSYKYPAERDALPTKKRM